MKKLLFVTGSYCRGKSGVSDYIYALSRFLHSKGFLCACVALNDGLVFDFRSIDPIPAAYKSFCLDEVIRDYSPEWISLQYVPYAFNAKGIPLNLLHLLSSQRQSLCWHVMAHELWVDPTNGIKNRLLSKVQREIFSKILDTIHPSVVHTTNYWYRDQLRGLGYPAAILPLFSNIPFVATTHVPPNANRAQWNFLLFGSINKDWRPEPLFHFIEQARRAHGVDLCRFVSVGNLPQSAIQLWDSFPSLGYAAFRFSRLGELSPEDASIQMQRADFGIAVTPSHLIGKSASAAAMHAHGLPIIINRLSEHCVDWQNHLKQTRHYILMDDTFIAQIGSATKFRPIDSLDAVADQFLTSLRQGV